MIVYVNEGFLHLKCKCRTGYFTALLSKQLQETRQAWILVCFFSYAAGLFKTKFQSFCPYILLGSPPELAIVAPSATPPEDKLAQSPPIPTVIDPETAEILARTTEPVLYSTPERANTASPDEQGAPHPEILPTTVSPTPTPMRELNTYDFKDPTSMPIRGDVLAPLQLPPLPTTRSKPSQLDISQGVEDGGQPGSGQGESSGAERQLQPGDTGTQEGQQAAVVFKGDVTSGVGLIDKSPAVPTEESAKPPFHLIIVNVNDQNQSGEWRGRGTNSDTLHVMLWPKLNSVIFNLIL